jgi:hypothetical protein
VLQIWDVIPEYGSRFFFHPGSNKEKSREKINKLSHLIWLTFIYFFDQVQKKELSQLTQNLSILNPKTVTKVSEIWARSGICHSEKTYILDPRSRGKKKHQIPDLSL